MVQIIGEGGEITLLDMMSVWSFLCPFGGALIVGKDAGALGILTGLIVGLVLGIVGFLGTRFWVTTLLPAYASRNPTEEDVIVRDEDCKTTSGRKVTPPTDDVFFESPEGFRLASKVVVSAFQIWGFVAAEDVVDPRSNRVLVEAGQEIDKSAADQIEKAGVTSVTVRSVLTCKSPYGICVKCYGRIRATGQLLQIGETVSIPIAHPTKSPLLWNIGGLLLFLALCVWIFGLTFLTLFVMDKFVVHHAARLLAPVMC